MMKLYVGPCLALFAVDVTNALGQSGIPASEIEAAYQRYDAMLSVYSARLRVAECWDPSVMTAEALHEWPEFKATGSVGAIVSITRNADKWRQEIEFDLDKKLQVIGSHIDQIEGFDGEHRYRLVPRGKSASVRKPTPTARRAATALPVESMFFHPSGDHGLSDCLRLGYIRQMHLTDGGDVELIIEKTSPKFKRRVILSRQHGWLPRQWSDLRDDPMEFRCRSTLEYSERNGQVLPIRGTHTQASRVADGRFLENYHTYSFETVDWSPQSQAIHTLDLQLPANYLVSDETSTPPMYKTDVAGNRVFLDKKVTIYRVRSCCVRAVAAAGRRRHQE